MLLKKIAQLCLAIIWTATLIATPSAAQAASSAAANGPVAVTGVTVIHAISSGSSQALSSLAASPSAPATPDDQPAQPVPDLTIPRSRGLSTAAASATTAPEADSSVQSTTGTASMPGLIANFEGVGNLDHVLPPDPNGDIGFDPATGKKYYFQWVNTHFEIWDVTNPAAPTVALGPTAGNTPWLSLGSDICSTHNQGDPVVVFDNLSHRWLLSQFAFDYLTGGVPTNGHQCVAVSQTANPAGAYYAYDFPWGSGQFNDYAKFGVWTDAYYATANQFVNGEWAGAGVVAINKAKLLAGSSSAEMLYIDLNSVEPNFGNILPATFTGLTAPPANAPGLFSEIDPCCYLGSFDALRVWQASVNWSNLTFTFGLSGQPNQVLQVANFDLLSCVIAGSRSCVPQPNTAQGLDPVGDRLMYRLNYRNYGDHQALVVNHTVSNGGAAGIRWYELRAPGATQSWSIYQQSTFAPADGNYRWMGSLALDHTGNLALGYSISSGATYPSIRYAGRLAGDPLNSLPQGEATLISGSGSQTSSYARWGDYSSMSSDPVDDCTFWYTQEYVQSTGSSTWQTRIGAFRYPTCTFSTTGTLAGTITDGASRPLSGVQISVTGTAAVQTTTNSLGFYQIDGLKAGAYNLTASLYGYTPFSKTGIAITANTTTTVNASLASRAAATLSGIVRDATPSGHTWPLYARIAAYSPDQQNPVGTQTTFSDPVTGAYSLPIYQGLTYTLVATAVSPGYNSFTQTGFTTSSPTNNLNIGLTGLNTCNAPGYAPNFFYFENFESGSGSYTAAGVAPSWAFGTPGTGPGVAHSGTHAWSTQNATGSYNNNEDSSLTSPSINLSGMTPSGSFVVSWWQYLVTEFGYDTASVMVSKDGGATWSSAVYGPVSGNISLGWTQMTVTLDSSYRTSAFRLRFNLTSDISITQPGWSVDDVGVFAHCSAPAGGLLVGTVTDANTLTGMDGAKVTSQAFPLEAGVAGAVPDSPTPHGYYTLFSTHTGSGADYLGSAAGGFQTDKRSVTIPAGGVARQDFVLTSGRLSVIPNNLVVDLLLGKTKTQTLKITNTGTAPLTYTFKGYLGAAPLLPEGPNLPGISWDGIYKSSSGQADKGEEEPEMAGSAPGSLGAVVDLSLPLPWGTILPNPIPLSRTAGAFVNGRLYLIGGEDQTGMPNGAVQVYNPAAHAWIELAATMPTAYSDLCAAAIGTDIYLPGGYDGATSVSLWTIFHTATQTWDIGDDLPAARSSVACAAYNGKLYVFGGADAGNKITATAWVYDPAKAAGSRWAALADAPVQAMQGAALAMPNGLIYYAGLRIIDGDLNTALAYNPASNAWIGYPNLQTPRGAAGMWSSGSTLFVGGGGGVALNSVEAYDTSVGTSGSWSYTNPMVQARSTFAYATDPQGALYAAGGWANAYLGNAERVRLPLPIPWLTTPASGSLNPGETVTVTLTFSTVGLAAGIYPAYLLVDDGVAYGGVPVSLQLDAGSILRFPFISVH